MPETVDEEDSPRADLDPAPPDNKVDAILDFEKMRSRVYDPLGKYKAPHIFPSDPAARHLRDQTHHNCTPRVSAKLTKENLLLHSQESSSFHGSPEARVQVRLAEIEDILSRSHAEMVEGRPENLEDFWESASAGNIEVPLGNVEQVVGSLATAIEDFWVSEPPAGDALVDSHSGERLEDLAPSAIETQMAGTIEDLWESAEVGNIVTMAEIEDLWESASVENEAGVSQEVKGEKSIIKDMWESDSQP